MTARPVVLVEIIITLVGLVASIVALIQDGPRVLRKIRDWLSARPSPPSSVQGPSPALEEYIALLERVPKPLQLHADNLIVAGTLEFELAQVLSTLPAEYHAMVIRGPDALVSQIVLPGIIFPLLAVALLISAFDPWSLGQSAIQLVIASLLGLASWRLTRLVIPAFRARMFFVRKGLRYELRLVQRVSESDD